MITVDNEELGEMLSRLQEQNKQREKDLRILDELIIMAALTKDGNKHGLS